MRNITGVKDVAALVVAMLLATTAEAQLLRAGAESDRFEVASIKPGPARPPLQSFPRLLPGGVFQVDGASLRDLIVWAYPAASGQVFMDAAPRWATTDRFDVTAKTSGARPTAAMLRTLLVERFKLRVRFEPREGNVFELSLARSDGRLGPSLTASNCVQGEAATEAERCKPIRIACCPGLIAEGATIADLAGTLTYIPDLNAPVLDRTGLQGRYNFNLQYRVDGLPNADQRPDLSSALREQLGLRLTRTKGTVDVLVLESADQLQAD